MTNIDTRSAWTVRREIEASEDVLEVQEGHRATYGKHHILEFELVH